MKASNLRAFGERAAKVGEELWPSAGDGSEGGEGLVKVAGVPYQASVTAPKPGGIFSDGGETQEGELVVRIRKTFLATEPARDCEVVYLGQKWQARRVGGKNAVDAAWVLHCEPWN